MQNEEQRATEERVGVKRLKTPETIESAARQGGRRTRKEKSWKRPGSSIRDDGGRTRKSDFRLVGTGILFRPGVLPLARHVYEESWPRALYPRRPVLGLRLMLLSRREIALAPAFFTSRDSRSAGDRYPPPPPRTAPALRTPPPESRLKASGFRLAGEGERSKRRDA